MFLSIALIVTSVVFVPFAGRSDTNKQDVDDALESTIQEESTYESTNEYTEETTEATTEPPIVMVEIPVAPVYPPTEEIITIYEASEAADLVDEYIFTLEKILDTLEEDHPQRAEISALLDTAMSYSRAYSVLIEEHMSLRQAELPVMTEIWNYLTTVGGFSPEVTAGIIGNMCAESGGCGYEDIDPYNWDNATGRSYYGVCQWSIYYTPQIANTDLHFQLEHIINSYARTFDDYGFLYSSRYGGKFRSENFVDLSSPYEAAVAFALCYERCARQHVEMRGPLAEKVYTYFTVLESWPWYGPRPET